MLPIEKSKLLFHFQLAAVSEHRLAFLLSMANYDAYTINAMKKMIIFIISLGLIISTVIYYRHCLKTNQADSSACTDQWCPLPGR